MRRASINLEIMSVLLQINKLKKSYGPHTILDGASFVVSSGQRIGVIGRNGAGKSTLFDIIVGKDAADSGEIILHESARIGFLKQEENFKENDRVLEYLMAKSGKADWQCAREAARFELKGELLEKRILDLSGGFQMRVKLSLMLLFEPNLMLLDEPTNYLDLRTMLLLEKFLLSYKGAFMIISHDRHFLKKLCRETLDIENGKAFHYPGPLEPYLAFKKEKLMTAQKYNKKQLEKQRHLQRFIDRFGAKASLATQAKSKAKQIKRLKYIDIEQSLGTAIIDIPSCGGKRGLAFVLDNSVIGYGSKVVASDIRFEIERGEHLALLGDNGQGKSSFIRSLAGNISFLSNPPRVAQGLRIAYYGQHMSAMLNPQDTVESYLQMQAAGNFEQEQICRMAGNFLFEDSDIKKPVSVLSGGERARLCLAGIFLKPHDVLLLDEPTNHLDFETAEALGQALAECDSAVIAISHDRTFTSMIADGIIEVRDGKIKRLFGDYEEYVERLEKDADKTFDSKITVGGENDRRLAYEEEKKRKKEAVRLEKRIEVLNREKADLHNYFMKNAVQPEKEKFVRLREIENEIKAVEEEWLLIES